MNTETYFAYNGIKLADAFWEESLNGCCTDEAGESETTGWYGLIDYVPDDIAEDYPNVVGGILFQGSQGGYELTAYVDKDCLMAKWEEVAEWIESMEDQSE